MQDIKNKTLALLFLILSASTYGSSYVSIASGSLSDPAVWTLPWVGAPLPPGSGQSVVISAGTTITGATSNSYSLTVSGTLNITGNYSNNSGGLTIADGGTMVISGNMTSSSSVTINGSGKLLIVGNLSQTGGSIAVHNTGILAVGTNFSEGWQTVTLTETATLLVIKDFYVQGNLNKGTSSAVVVLGTTTGGGCTGCTNTIPTTDPAWTFWADRVPSVWTGASDTNWTNTANWSAGIVPVSGAGVEFSATASRDLVLDADRIITSLKNLSTKQLLIPAGKCLTVTTTITTNNDPNQIYIQASYSGATGSLIFHNAVGSPVNATVEMYSMASWNLANAAGNKYRWQFFGIPLRSLSSTSPTFDGAYVRKMNENDSPTHWQQLTNTSPMTSFAGYEITQSAAKTYVFQGILENSDYSVRQSYTSGVSCPGLNMIANSYTSAIDITKITFGTQMLATVYLYNTGSQNDWVTSGQNPVDSTTAYAGQFTAVPFALAGTGSLPRQIPSMQAFMVKAKMSNLNATVNIPYSTNLTTVKNTTMQRISAAIESEVQDKVWTLINIKGSRLSDKMWIYTDPQCSHNFDNGWDGEKFLGSVNSPQIYAMEPEGDYQVTTVNDMNNTDIGFLPGQDSIYTLTFTHHNFSSIYAGMYLLDLVENTVTKLPKDGGNYTFTSAPSATPVKRFKILTRLNTPSALKSTNENNTQLSIFSSENTIYVHNRTAIKGMMMVYTISGQLLNTLPFGENTITSIPVNLATGTYIVRAKTATEDLTEKVVLR